MNEAQVRTLEQVRQVVAGTQALEFRPPLMAGSSRRHALSIAVIRALAVLVTAPHGRDLREPTIPGIEAGQMAGTKRACRDSRGCGCPLIRRQPESMIDPNHRQGRSSAAPSPRSGLPTHFGSPVCISIENRDEVKAVLSSACGEGFTYRGFRGISYASSRTRDYRHPDAMRWGATVKTQRVLPDGFQIEREREIRAIWTPNPGTPVLPWRIAKVPELRQFARLFRFT